MGFYVSLERKQELMSELILLWTQPSLRRAVTVGEGLLWRFTRLKANGRTLGFSGKHRGGKDCTAKISVMAEARTQPEGNWIIWFFWALIHFQDCLLTRRQPRKNSLLDERLSVHSAHRAVSLFPHGGWCACKPTVWDRSGGEAWHAVGSQYLMAIKKGRVHLGWLYYYLINWNLFKGLGFGGELRVVYSKSLFYFPVLTFPSTELSLLYSKSRSQFPVCILPSILAESRKSYMLRKVVENNSIVLYVCLFSILFHLVCTCCSYDGTRKRQGDGRNSGKPLRFDQSQEKLF